MSDRPRTPDSVDTGWVVDVTAPISPSRVQWIAADAAARLKLPVEKLASLLDNRVGPVTKPLPKASAERVAEVLHLAGAEVRLRPTAEERTAEEAVEQEPTVDRPRPDEDRNAVAYEAPWDDDTGASRSPRRAPIDQGPTEPRPDEPRLEAPSPEARSPEAPSADEPRIDERNADEPNPNESNPDESNPDEPSADEPASDDWARGFGSDPSSDTAMLGDWRRGEAKPARRVASEETREGSRTGAADAPETKPETPDEQDAQDTRAAGDPAESSIGRRGRRRVATSRGRGETSMTGRRRATSTPLEEPPVLIDEDEEGDAFAYGTRDPFAEAERRERANRRWVLMGALVLAVAAFVAVQWAYSRPGVDDRTPPAYEAGLEAYRQGAFVSAARSWRARAEAGDVRAMHMLGYMAEFGQGRPWSNAEAAGWYQQAAERGHPPAQLRLASLYARGLGVDHDPEAALAWALRAARAGDVDAAWRVVQDLVVRGAHDDAYAWLRHAAPRHDEAAAWLALVEAAPLNERSD